MTLFRFGSIALFVLGVAACGGKDSGGGDIDAGGSVIDGGAVDAIEDCGDGLVTGAEQCDDSNSSNDDECLNNCMLACGDGVVNAVELCDTGISAGDPGACPTACDDSDACTVDVLAGDMCQAECVNTAITTAIPDDGCCPAGINSTQDNDCSPVCGNDVVESGETCDTTITTGNTGACPIQSDCVDSLACTEDNLTNGGTCTATCENPAITMDINDDGCCPAGSTIADDNDCSASCGDGVVTAADGELCDTLIAAGNAGACPVLADCDDSDSCTTDSLVSGGTCQAQCSNVAIEQPADNDMCCPVAFGANANNDNDCSPVCPNSVTESGETCDDGNSTNGDGCDDTCQIEKPDIAFRIDSLELRDPHAFTQFFGCRDITSNLNGEFDDQITTDGDADGNLDLNVVSLFKPFDSAAMSTPVDLIFADCTAPIGTTMCSVAGTPINSTANNQSAGICLVPVPNTTDGWSPAITTPAAPCFATDQETLTIDANGLIITLNDAQVGAT